MTTISMRKQLRRVQLRVYPGQRSFTLDLHDTGMVDDWERRRVEYILLDPDGAEMMDGEVVTLDPEGEDLAAEALARALLDLGDDYEHTQPLRAYGASRFGGTW